MSPQFSPIYQKIKTLETKLESINRDVFSSLGQLDNGNRPSDLPLGTFYDNVKNGCDSIQTSCESIKEVTMEDVEQFGDVFENINSKFSNSIHPISIAYINMAIESLTESYYTIQSKIKVEQDVQFV